MLRVQIPASPPFTMKQFKELVMLVKACRKLCPWTKEQTIESYKKELVSETRELVRAIGKKDYRNVKEELGDVLWDTIMMAHIAEHKGYFKMEDVIKEVNEKFRRRKPYIVESRRVSLAEAKRIWKKVKEEEKMKK